MDFLDHPIFRTVLIVFAVIGFFAQFILGPLAIRKMQRIDADLPNLPSAEIREIYIKRKGFAGIKLLEELKSRGEDISFALPFLLRQALQWNPAGYMMGRPGLREHFADEFPGMDFMRPSKSDKERMKARLRELGG